MSTKRVLGVTIFGVVFIAAVIGVMLVMSHFRVDGGAFTLPEPTAPSSPAETVVDNLSRVEVTPDTVQAVIATLSRPEAYSRVILVESFWEGGMAEYHISTAVYGGVTGIRTMLPSGAVRRVAITPENLYIWYEDDSATYVGRAGNADRWRMLVTYEDVLALSTDGILDAGVTERHGQLCIYVVHRSPHLGFLKRYYVSIDLGLVIEAREYDDTGMLVYLMMEQVETIVGEPERFYLYLPEGYAIS